MLPARSFDFVENSNEEKLAALAALALEELDDVQFERVTARYRSVAGAVLPVGAWLASRRARLEE